MTVPSFAVGTTCASFVSSPVTVLCPSCTENIETVSCASSVPLVEPALTFTVTCTGASVGPGSSVTRIVIFVPSAVAAALSVIVVLFATEATVAPIGIPVPVIRIPTL